ncbi:hypothetical protein V6N13_001528 [Hibiscus sabdariffa]
MSMEDLIARLRIEEENRGNDKKLIFKEAKANLVEVKKGKQPQQHQARPKLGPGGGISKNEKFKGACYNCGKVGTDHLNAAMQGEAKRRLMPLMKIYVL